MGSLMKTCRQVVLLEDIDGHNPERASKKDTDSDLDTVPQSKSELHVQGVDKHFFK